MMPQSTRYAVLVALTVLAACSVDPDAVRVAITYSGPPNASPLRLSVVVGPDKFHHNNLEPGSRTDGVLRPDGSLPVVVLNGFIGTRSIAWAGPEFARGTGYDMNVRVDEQGRVSETHCIRPCDLWPGDGLRDRMLRAVR